jgi:hypothetical protein
MACEQGGSAEAHTCFDASVRMHRMLGYRAGERRALNGLGLLLDGGLGRHTEADDYVAQDPRIVQELGDRQGEGYARLGHGRHALLGWTRQFSPLTRRAWSSYASAILFV